MVYFLNVFRVDKGLLKDSAGLTLMHVVLFLDVGATRTRAIYILFSTGQSRYNDIIIRSRGLLLTSHL